MMGFSFFVYTYVKILIKVKNTYMCTLIKKNGQYVLCGLKISYKK